jgi:hypothetical protein
MMRFLALLAAIFCFSRAAAAQWANDATSDDDSAWSDAHTVKARGPHSESPSHRSSLTDDRIALLGHLGIGAPAGAIGLDVDLAPVSFLALDLGAGLSPNGWQVAATPRLRIRVTPTGFITLGSGPSLGPYDNSHSVAGVACVFLCLMDGMGDSSGSIASQHYERALWYNLEFGADVYAREGRGMMRVTIGYGQILNSTAYSCTEDPKDYYSSHNGCDRSTGQGLLFATIAGGFNL